MSTPTTNPTDSIFDIIGFAPMSRFLAVPCAHCAAPVGAECRTPVGKQRSTHMLRWQAARSASLSGQFWMLLHADDERFGLRAGDLLRCIDYPYDAKVTVLFRESDGFDPECNQYLSDVAFLGFVPRDMEVSLR